MQISTNLPQATAADSSGGGVRVIKLAQDQQKAEGEAAVQLIESAGAVAQATTGSNPGQSIDVYV